MKPTIIVSTLSAALLFAQSNADAMESSTQLSRSTTMPVRILLEEKPYEEAQWHLICEGGFDLSLEGSEKPISISKPTIDIWCTDEGVRVNDTIFVDIPLTLVPQKGYIRCNDKLYTGSLSLHIEDDTVSLVNQLNLEDHIEAVLRAETYPGWPDEILRALSIATRTYTIYNILERRADKDWEHPYDLRSTILDQVYKGHNLEESLAHIVKETEGLIITRDNKPILAVYHAVCGGVNPSLIDTTWYEKAPYLKREYPCTHCTEQTYYHWEKSISFDVLEASLKELFPNLGTIQDIIITSRDEAQLAQNVMIVNTANYVYHMSPHDFRMRFYDIIKSLCCTFETKDRVLYATGKGWGHHIGICQWGAYSMTKKGHSWKEVLEYYYPETELTRLDDLNIN